MEHSVLTRTTLGFLKDLKKNNNRDWFTENKKEFKTAQLEFKGFCEALTARMNQHDKIEKTKVFRIYRDVRFSADKTPYKTHFAASFIREGAARRGGYYLHVKPGETILAGGFWAPESKDLLRIRKELEMDAGPFKKVISQSDFKACWGKLEGEAVKSAPRGFSKEHPDIDLIRKKQFIFTRSFNDKQVLSADFLETVNDSFAHLRPYFDLMSEILTTDLNGVSLLD